MSTMLSRKAAYAAALASALAVGMASQAEASSVTYGFYNITHSNATNAATAGQYSVEITDMTAGIGAGQIDFIFRNASGGAASYISDIYFDSGPLDSIVSIQNGLGVAFDHPVSGQENFPGGNSLNPKFETTEGLSAQDDGGSDNGVDPGEYVGIRFKLNSGKTYDDVLDAIYLGWIGQGADPEALRIGIHVQSYANGGSESFVNTPVPAALPIIGAALAGFGFVGWRQQRKPA